LTRVRTTTMTKFLALLLIGVCLSTASFASHFKGGWIQYEYLGPGDSPGLSQFRITVHQYITCSRTAADTIMVSIFDLDKLPGTPPLNIKLGQSQDYAEPQVLRKTSFDTCIIHPPDVCYNIYTFQTIIQLANNTNGYTFETNDCCRLIAIENVNNASGTVGILYSTTMPGAGSGPGIFPNSSAVFQQLDTVLVCANTPFTFDFSATDPDGDSLAYSFTNGFDDATSSPPFTVVPYMGGYTGASPMGSAVTISPTTGLMSGVAPGGLGDYVIAVMAYEYRHGILVGMTRKELHITVSDCHLTAATLKVGYLDCHDLTVSLVNESSSPDVVKYLWTFGETSIPYSKDTSNSPTPTHTYASPGTYPVKLVVTSSVGCRDSATSVVKVYPLKVGFTVTGSCIINPYQFTDTTHSYGITTWSWDFGETTVPNDVSSLQNPTYTYPQPGIKTVKMVLSSSVGCIDSATYSLDVSSKPTLSMLTKDTSICDIDTATLRASGMGSFAWTSIPANNTILPTDINSPTPKVYPKDTTKYAVEVNYMGCINNDTVTVNVLHFLTVSIRPDTIVCQTDTFRLHPVSAATAYQWTASTGEVVAPVKYPLVKPLVNTTYHVTANPGQCQDTTSILVQAYPYPIIKATPDTSICWATVAPLYAHITGDVYTWSPTGSLFNPNTLTPIAAPTNTTTYILTVANTTGCLKPVKDTIVVTVLPKVLVDAGRDTIVFVNQPLQLFTVTNTDPQKTSFTWTPVVGLNNPSIQNPIATLGYSIDSITYTVTAKESHGCTGQDDIKVIVYKVPAPEIFMPTAFTPNGDGKNDVLKPTTVGIATLGYFRVYNRLGQLLFSTSEFGKGWDGTFGGTAQPTGAYVYEVLGIDFLGKSIVKQGTCVLIR